MAAGLVEASFFELSGAASITYDLRTSELYYGGPSRPPLRDFWEFRERASLLDTPIGRLVTGTIRSVEDGDTDTVTVLLPRVNLPPTGDSGGAAETAFETVAIWTTTRSTIGGPGLVEGPVQDYIQATMHGIARLADGRCEFSATLTRELPGPGTLRVEGTCIYGQTGYRIELVRHEPQGSNPEDLLLKLNVVPPEVGGWAITTYPVHYEEETEIYYRTVTILPDGPTIDVHIIT